MDTFASYIFKASVFCQVVISLYAHPLHAQAACSNSNFGDANGDGQINVMDVVTISNVVLGTMSENEIHLSCADLHCDGQLNVADIVSLIDMLLDPDFDQNIDSDGDGFCDSDVDEDLLECDEVTYWYTPSGDNPYPGLACDLGPTKTLPLSFLVPQDTEGEYVSDEYELAEALLNLNLKYTSLGITFALGEIVYIDETYTAQNYGTLFYDYAIRTDVNVILFPPAPEGQEGDSAYRSTSTYPWSSATRVKVNANNITGHTLSHELGHFFGLYHTHEQANWNSLGAPDDTWIPEEETCEDDEDFMGFDGTQGDFVASTNFDCLDDCSEFFDCVPYESATDDHQMEVFYQECLDKIEEVLGFVYAPPTTNLMSYYSQTREHLNSEQGARMRHYVNYRLETLYNGGYQLELVDDGGND